MTIVILGSSGHVGTATLKALELYPKLDIRVGCRDVTKFHSLPANFRVVYADMNNIPSLEQALMGATSVFIIPPPSEDRAALAMNAINAAVIARVPHVLLMSIASVTAPVEHLFQKQFLAVEYALRASKLHYTILRCPLFVDNLWGNVETIKNEGTIYGPIRGDIAYAPVVVSDIGTVAAKILSHPKTYYSKIYRLTTPVPITHNDIAGIFSRTLGRPINYVPVPAEQAKQAMIGKGYPEWQANGVLELYKLIETGSAETNTASPDLTDLLGRPATTVDSWISGVKSGFE